MRGGARSIYRRVVVLTTPVRSGYLLGLDLGTGSTKAVLVNRDGLVTRVARAPVRIFEPRPGFVESDPAEWWESVVRAVREVVANDAHAVDAIGLSGQMHGVVLAKADCTPLRPAIVSLDRRARADLAAYRALAPENLSRLANPLVPNMAGPMLHWVKTHEPDVFAGAAVALQAKDWVRLRLVGTAASEPSDASGTLLFDVAAGTWAWPVIAGLGLPASLLPPLATARDLAGGLTKEAAGELGLVRGTPVAFGAADTACALVGTGLRDDGSVQVTVGSAAQVVVLRHEPQPDPNRRAHLFAAADPGVWYAMGAVQIAGVALDWVLGVLRASFDEAYDALAITGDRDSDVLFVPHLAGARSPTMDPAATGAFVNLELACDRADILRAAFEGVAFSILDAAAVLPEFAAASEVLLGGGGTLEARWRRLLCDVLGKRLVVVSEPHASGKGAALIAASLAGVAPDTRAGTAEPVCLDPDEATHAKLAARFERWRQADLNHRRSLLR